jgi:hypothetical protein
MALQILPQNLFACLSVHSGREIVDFRQQLIQGTLWKQ